MPKAKPPSLPPDAPQDVKDFVDCKSDSITLDPTKKGFLPEIPIIGAPNVTLDAVAGKPGTVKVSLKKTGLLDTSFTITVKAGHLDADTTGVTPQMVKDAVDRWVKRYNDWLDANNRKLDGITLDKGKATIKKVPVAGAGGAGQPAEGGKGGVKKAVAVGAGVLILGTGSYLGYQALGSDSGAGGPDGPAAAETSTSPAGPSASTSEDSAGPGLGSRVYTCDPVANCGTTFDALLRGVGVAISHDGSPGSDAPSDAEVVGVTTWPGAVQVTADCGFGSTTGQAMPDDQGVVRIHLGLYDYGPCEVVQLKLRRGATFSNGTRVEAFDAWKFDVTPTPTKLQEAAVQQAIDSFGLIDADSAIDAKVIGDVMVGRNTCFIDTLLSDPVLKEAIAVLCESGWVPYGLYYDLPGLDSVLAGPLAAGGVQISGFDRSAYDALFGPGGPLECGIGNIAVTICPEGEVAEIGPAMFFQAVVPRDQTGVPLVFDLGSGNTVSITSDSADSTVDVTGDIRPYVMIRNQAISVFVPNYRTQAFSVAGGPDLPPWPAIPYAGQADDSAPLDLEAVREFATQLAQSLASGDKAFALDHLDPAVLQVFPTECPGHFAVLDDPTYAIHVVGLGATGSYRYAPPSAGGTAVDVSGVVTVRARLTDSGETRPARLHFGHGDAGITWFADCGTAPN